MWAVFINFLPASDKFCLPITFPKSFNPHKTQQNARLDLNSCIINHDVNPESFFLIKQIYQACKEFIKKYFCIDIVGYAKIEILQVSPVVSVLEDMQLFYFSFMCGVKSAKI